MAESDLDHMMASFHVETFSPNQVPADSNQFGDMYPAIANTQNPSNLPRGVVEIPTVTLDDTTPVDVNDFMQLSVPKRTHQIDNSYSNINLVDYSSASALQSTFSQANLHDQGLIVPSNSWGYQASGESFTPEYQTASIQTPSASFGVEGARNPLPYRPSNGLSPMQDMMSGLSFDTTSFQDPSMLSAPKASQISNGSRRGRHQKPRGSRNGVKKKSSKIHPRICLAQFENALQEHSKSSPYFKQVLLQVATLLRPVKQLIDNEIFHGESSQPPTDNMSLAINSLSRESRSVSEVTDSGYRTEDTSISSTPRPQKYDTLDSMSESGHILGIEGEDTTIYPCSAAGCNKIFKNYSDWKRHEETHWPFRRFMCLDCNSPHSDPNGQWICPFCQAHMMPFSNPGEHYLQCIAARENATTFTRKYGLNNHLRKQHGMETKAANQQSKDWHYPIPSNWPRECPPCRMSFRTWEERVKHIATRHYQKGDHRPQGFYPKPKDDDSDDEDDCDDNSRPFHKRAAPYASSFDTASQNQSQNEASSAGPANSSWSQYECNRHTTGDSSSSHKRFKQNISTTTQIIRRMSVPLERYLHDDEDTTAGILNAQYCNKNNEPKANPTLPNLPANLSGHQLDSCSVLSMVSNSGSNNPETFKRTSYDNGELSGQRSIHPFGKIQHGYRRDLKLENFLFPWNIEEKLPTDFTKGVNPGLNQLHQKRNFRELASRSGLAIDNYSIFTSMNFTIMEIAFPVAVPRIFGIWAIEPNGLEFITWQGFQDLQREYALSTSPIPGFLDTKPILVLLDDTPILQNLLGEEVDTTTCQFSPRCVKIELGMLDGSKIDIRRAESYVKRSPGRSIEASYASPYEVTEPKAAINVHRNYKLDHDKTKNAKSKATISEKKDDSWLSTKTPELTASTRLPKATPHSLSKASGKLPPEGSPSSKPGFCAPEALCTHKKPDAFDRIDEFFLRSESPRYFGSSSPGLVSVGSSTPTYFSTLSESKLSSARTASSMISSSVYSSRSSRSVSSISGMGTNRSSSCRSTSNPLRVAPPWQPPTLNQTLAMAPFNYGYDLPCEFGFIGCHLRFHPEDFEAWIDHSISHFGGYRPPTRAVCSFCDSEFDCIHNPNDAARNWRRRMEHIGGHFYESRRADGAEVNHRRPDFWILDHLRSIRLISHQDYSEANEYTERPRSDVDNPSVYGWKPQEMLTREDRGSDTSHELRKEKHQLRKVRERGSRTHSHRHRA